MINLVKPETALPFRFRKNLNTSVFKKSLGTPIRFTVVKVEIKDDPWPDNNKLLVTARLRMKAEGKPAGGKYFWLFDDKGTFKPNNKDTAAGTLFTSLDTPTSNIRDHDTMISAHNRT